MQVLTSTANLQQLDVHALGPPRLNQQCMAIIREEQPAEWGP